MRPKTAYDYRRCITLVQVLALYPNDEALNHLAGSWQCEDEHGRAIEHMPYSDLVEMLAQHALEHVRNEPKDS
jgi:hypothetical protein